MIASKQTGRVYSWMVTERWYSIVKCQFAYNNDQLVPLHYLDSMNLLRIDEIFFGHDTIIPLTIEQ